MSKDEKVQPKKRNRRATTVEGREDEMISLAMRRAEEKLLDGTASNSLIIHFLRLGSTKAQLEREILEEQKKLTVAKTEALESSKVMESLYREAINAFKEYNGSYEDDEYEDLQ